MSLTITVRKGTETTGGDDKPLPASGDNGNQEIDTKGEAEAALTFVTGDDLVAVLGGKTYTRRELIAIRDRNAAPKVEASTEQGTGVSHGVGVEGYYLGSFGDNGHNGGGARLYYEAGVPVVKGDHRLFVDIKAGGDVSGYSSVYTAPNGETVASAFTGGGLVLGAGLRYSPPIMGNRLSLSIVPDLLIGGFGTADSTTVSLPATCTPGDFGRGECEPNAGPRAANAGTTGLYNPDLGAARGTSGVLVGTDIPLTLAASVAKGEWGHLDFTGSAAFSYRHVVPGDGHAFGFPGISGMFGVSGRFGGGDSIGSAKLKSAVKDADGDGVADTDDKCADTKAGETIDADGCSDSQKIKTIQAESVDPMIVSALDPAPRLAVTFDSDIEGTLTGALNSDKPGEAPIPVTFLPNDQVQEGENKKDAVVPANTLKKGKYVLDLTITGEDGQMRKVVGGPIRVKEGADALQIKEYLINPDKKILTPGSELPVMAMTNLPNTKVTLEFLQPGSQSAQSVTFTIQPGKKVKDVKVPADLDAGEYTVKATFEAGGMKSIDETQKITVHPAVLGELAKEYEQKNVLPSITKMRILGVEEQLVEIEVEGTTFKKTYQAGVGQVDVPNPPIKKASQVTLKTDEKDAQEFILDCPPLLQKGKKSTLGKYKVTIRTIGTPEKPSVVLKEFNTEVVPPNALGGGGKARRF